MLKGNILKIMNVNIQSCLRGYDKRISKLYAPNVTEGFIINFDKHGPYFYRNLSLLFSRFCVYSVFKNEKR